MSSQLLGATPLNSVVATSLSAKQISSLGPLGVGTVSARETASAGGYAVSLFDSAGATASIPLYSVTSAGGPPITSATLTASVPISHAGAGQAGTSTIAAGQQNAPQVANTAITANSIVLLTPVQANTDATATSFTVVLQAGVGFTVRANANATANTVVGYFIAEY